LIAFTEKAIYTGAMRTARPLSDINLQRESRPWGSHIARSSGASEPVAPPSELAPLLDSEISLVSFQRALPAGIDETLAEWTRHHPATFDKVVNLASYNLKAATQGLPEWLSSWLTLDIAMLSARLSHLANSPRLRICFGAIRNDQCRKFHTDYLRYRLISTYTGPGTEWLPEEAVSREALKLRVACPQEANQKIVSDPSAVRRATPGEVIVMRGSMHPSGKGVVHRSPPIEATGQVRVVLVISTVGA
jgi:hypothetical protein